MSAINSQGLTVITVPLKLKKQIEKVNKLKQVYEKQKILKCSRAGNLSKPVITCKNPKLNFYKGQTYDQFAAVPLASRGWKNRKSKGDFFTIHKYLENPAFMNIDLESSKFEDLGLDDRVVEQLNKNGFVNPTNIQTLAIPSLLERNNTVIAAETGNGKTLSYLAPIFHQILRTKDVKNDCIAPAFNSPQALILLPSRELVAQTRDMARSIAADLGIRINSIFGGRTKSIMLEPRAWEHDILIGSFGAISKLMTSRVYKRNHVNHIVLDEADTLLDDSFNDQMHYFLSKFPMNEKVEGCSDNFTGIQVSLVGATFPTSLNSILQNIVDVNNLTRIKTPFLHRISPHITQTFLRIGHDQRSERLLKLAKKNFKEKLPTIIFSNTSKCSDYVSLFLNDNGIPCINVNGDMESFRRIKRFERFQEREFNFISCTDLVSRGLNTVRAKHILNYDFPKFISDYIHRCGRTGRLGSEEDCFVTNFVIYDPDIDLVQKIEYAARKVEDLPNVNANIKRIITARTERYQQNLLAKEASEEEEELK